MTIPASETADQQLPKYQRRHPIIELMMSRLREFYREPSAVFWVYVFPLLMTLVLGIAFRNRSVEKVEVAVEQGSAAESILTILDASPAINARIVEPREAERQLRVGKVDLIIRPLPESGSPDSSTPSSKPIPAYQFELDPTRPNSIMARGVADDALQRAAGRKDIAVVEELNYDKPGGRYIDFLVPGLIGLGVMGGGMWGVGFAIVDMRIRKLLKRFLATPMRKSHFLLSMIISRLLFTLPEVVLLLLFARFLFGVVSYGNYAVIMLIILIGAIQFGGIGLLVASRAKTLETVSGLMNMVMMPMWLGSGVFFSSERFPEIVQPIIRILPLTPIIRSLRAVMLEGATLASQSTELAIMIAWTILSFTLALFWFRWND